MTTTNSAHYALVRSFLVSIIAIEGLATLPARKVAMGALCAKYQFPFDIKGEFGVQVSMLKNHLRWVLQTRNIPRPIVGMREVRALQVIPVQGTPFRKLEVQRQARNAAGLFDKAEELCDEACKLDDGPVKEAMFEKASKARHLASQLQRRIGVMLREERFVKRANYLDAQISHLTGEMPAIID
jgi:hypothetical protein